MATPLLPPDPSLVAIILVVKYNSGPRFVFHYPPKPGQDATQFKTGLEDDLNDDDSSSSSGSESDSSTNKVNEKSQSLTKDQEDGTLGDLDDETGSASPEKQDSPGSFKDYPRWDDIFGFSHVTFEQMLCPAQAFHKRRFELGLDELLFLGWPVFAKDNGLWQRKEKVKESKHSTNKLNERPQARQDEPSSVDNKSSIEIIDEFGETSGQGTEGDLRSTKFAGRTEDMLQHNDPSEKTTQPISHKMEDGDLKPGKKIKTLRMFHVVFVMNPAPLEFHFRAQEMYDNIVKKFSRALKWEQNRSDYVSRESSNILKIKKEFYRPGIEDNDLGRLYHKILSQSALAKAIATLYRSICTSRIAHLNLSPALSFSLQIPIPTSTAILPSITSPQVPGLWLTTANSLALDDDIDSNNVRIASHFTLLLLADLSIILSEVAATSSPLTDPLTHFLHAIIPTKSFLQISQSSSIPIRDIQFLASHLVYWRRARAIPPLHQRDTYIVSPNANIRKLTSASTTFAKAFPTLPSLPKILTLLSSIPKPFSTLIPSKDHKAAYLEILAWLLRFGWVTQLRTFAWIRVPPHIRSVVAQDDEQYSQQYESAKTTTASLQTPFMENDAIKIGEAHLPPSPTSSVRTTILVPSTAPESMAASLLPHPNLASGLSSRYLSAISSHIGKVLGEDTKAAWDKCIKYFDGQHAIEIIAAREGWKRKKAAELITVWEEMGLLVKGRHW